MKKLLVMVAAVVAGYAAVAAPAEFLCIEVGGTLNVLDAKVREREGLGAPTLVNLVIAKYSYYDCDSVKPRGGYDNFGVSVSTNNVVLSVSAWGICPDEKTAAEKKEKILSEFRTKYADRIAPEGNFTMEVSADKDGASGKPFVDVVIYTAEFKATLDRNYKHAK